MGPVLHIEATCTMLGEPTVLAAGCKINLFLQIIGLREDGYHELSTLFYPLPEPCDKLRITEGERGAGLSVFCDHPALGGGSNILHKAYSLYAGATGFSPDLKIILEKGIPIGAGLGGGSSDAAVLLGFMNDNAGSSALREDELVALAAKTGADVAFFLKNVPSLAKGIGDVLRPVDVDLDPFELLLVCPNVHVCTAEAYKSWDRLQKDQVSLTKTETGDKKPFCFSDVVLFNSFESAVFPLYPVLRELKMAMLGIGAACCLMSGSGSSLYALFRSGGERREACLWLESRAIPYFSHQPQRWGVAKR
jgi:4-diphosphocytidyl-2-C-methyl-D-erythritol kinase